MALPQQGSAYIIAGRHQIRFQFDRFAILFDGFTCMAFFIQYDSQVVVSFLQIRIQRQGPSKIFFGLVNQALSLLGRCQIGVGAAFLGRLFCTILPECHGVAPDRISCIGPVRK